MGQSDEVLRVGQTRISGPALERTHLAAYSSCLSLWGIVLRAPMIGRASEILLERNNCLPATRNGERSLDARWHHGYGR